MTGGNWIQFRLLFSLSFISQSVYVVGRGLSIVILARYKVYFIRVHDSQCKIQVILNPLFQMFIGHKKKKRKRKSKNPKKNFIYVHIDTFIFCCMTNRQTNKAVYWMLFGKVFFISRNKHSISNNCRKNIFYSVMDVLTDRQITL